MSVEKKLELSERIKQRRMWQDFIDQQEHLFLITLTCKPGITDQRAKSVIHEFVQRLNWFQLKGSDRRKHNFIKGFCVLERSELKNMRQKKYMHETLHCHIVILKQTFELPDYKFFEFKVQKAIDSTNKELRQSKGDQSIIGDFDVRRCDQRLSKEFLGRVTLGRYLTKNFDNYRHSLQACVDAIGLLQKDSVSFGNKDLDRLVSESDLKVNFRWTKKCG